MGPGSIVMLQKVFMSYQIEIKEEKEKTQDICINEPCMKGKREDTGFIHKRDEKEKTHDICIYEPSMRGKREDTRFNLNHTI